MLIDALGLLMAIVIIEAIRKIRWTCTNRRDKAICKNPNIKEVDILAGLEEVLGEKPTRMNCSIIEQILVDENGDLVVEVDD